jgi:hypothetical protein
MIINTSQKVALWIIFALISEGMIVKSAIFLDNDPTLFHYIISATLGFMLFTICIINRFTKYIISWQFIIFTICIFWSFFSSVKTGYTPNIIAVFTFGGMFLFFFTSIPIIIYSVNKNTIKVLYVPFFLMSFSSIVLYYTELWSVIDPASGRFLGSYISVANAGVGFSFFTAFSVAILFSSQEKYKKIFYGVMIFIGLYLCFLTKTRSVALETIVFIAVIYYGNRISTTAPKGSWFVPTLVAIGLSSAVLVAVVGDFDWNDTAADYRISEGRLQDSRTGNWAFGVERTWNAPLFGEGMLTKQTQGGTRSLDLANGDNYDSAYDPHSLILSFSVQAGIPFSIGMMILIFGTILQYIRVFGLKNSLNSPEFVICTVHTLVMIPTGGDLTSFGNFSDRIYWILLGMIALRSNLAKTKKIEYRYSPIHSSNSRAIIV